MSDLEILVTVAVVQATLLVVAWNVHSRSLASLSETQDVENIDSYRGEYARLTGAPLFCGRGMEQNRHRPELHYISVAEGRRHILKRRLRRCIARDARGTKHVELDAKGRPIHAITSGASRSANR